MNNMATSEKSNSTSLMLTLGMIAGPLYVIVGIIEGTVRKGFSFVHNDLSVLANGEFGWIHSGLLIVTGLMTVLAAIGMKRAMQSGKGSTWGPRLLGLYGLGLVGAGFFTADPANGFPPGTPDNAHTVSWHGGLHLLFGAIGFLGLIAACFIFANRFKAAGENGWVLFSRFTGFFYLFAFIGIVVGSNGSSAVLGTVILLFSAAAILGWTWILAVSNKYKAELAKRIV